jgi:hydrogenase nickel incorporation protein HypA/HybF
VAAIVKRPMLGKDPVGCSAADDDVGRGTGPSGPRLWQSPDPETEGYARNEAPPMHELSICNAIANTAAKHADGHSVSQVNVQIGHLRQVVPDALQFSWHVVSEATALRDAVLVIEQVPAVVKCRSCGARTTLDVPMLACGQCEGFDVKLISGEELVVVSIDLVDA